MSRPHTPDEERRIREAALDETLADTFPASDPLSSDPNPEADEAAPRNGEPGPADDDSPGPDRLP